MKQYQKYAPDQGKNMLLVGALVATSAASLLFGTKYYRAMNQLSQPSQETLKVDGPRDRTAIEDRIQDAYGAIATKTEKVIIPAVKKDYKKIAGYGGSGLLAGLALAYFAGRKNRRAQ
jgi:hypothetical protein